MSAAAEPQEHGPKTPAEGKASPAPRAAVVDPGRKYRWVGLAGIAVGAITMVAALSLAVHVHEHERSIQSAISDIRTLQEKQSPTGLPPEDLVLLRQAIAAQSASTGQAPTHASAAGAGPTPSPSLLGAALSDSPALFAKAELELSRGDVEQARRTYCRFLACAGEARGSNGEWVTRARFRLIECDARLVERRLPPRATGVPPSVEKRS